MNFDSIKEQFRDRALEVWSRIQETSLYMNLREKYEALTPQVQKIIIWATGAIVLLFLLSFPYGYISTSQENMATFEENRGLIRDLLKSSATLREPSPLPPAMPPDALIAEVGRSLDEFHLVPEQVSPVQPIFDKVTNLAPEPIQQVGATVSLKKLNLKQIVEISHRLQTLNYGTKLIGMDVRESSTASHYFDVVFKVASFSIPQPGGSDAGGSDKKGAKKKVNPKKDNDETDF